MVQADRAQEDRFEEKTGESVAHDAWSLSLKIVVVCLMLAITTLLNIFLKGIIQPSSLVFIYIVPTIAGAIFFGTWAAVFSFVAGFLLFNFLFVEPFYTFHISAPQDVYNIGVYFAVAGLITYLIGIVRRQNALLRDRLDRVSLIEDMSRDYLLLAPLQKAFNSTAIPESMRSGVLSQLGQVALRYIKMILNVPALIFFAEPDGNLKVWGKSSLDLEVADEDRAAAEWTFTSGEVSGAGTFNHLDTGYFFIPIKAHEVVIGALGIRYDSRQLFREQRRFLGAVSNLTSLVAGRWIDLKYEQA